MRVKLNQGPKDSSKEMMHSVIDIIFFSIGFFAVICEMVRRSRHGSKTES
jgi:hypothetical protein